MFPVKPLLSLRDAGLRPLLPAGGSIRQQIKFPLKPENKLTRTYRRIGGRTGNPTLNQQLLTFSHGYYNLKMEKQTETGAS